MQKQREFERNVGTPSDKTLQFAQELTSEFIMDLGGVEGPKLQYPNSNWFLADENPMKSSQKELDNISMEPHEFTHPILAYQVLEIQLNVQAEQTL